MAFCRSTIFDFETFIENLYFLSVVSTKQSNDFGVLGGGAQKNVILKYWRTHVGIAQKGTMLFSPLSAKYKNCYIWVTDVV